MACSFSAITVTNSTVADLGTAFNVYARLKSFTATCTVTWSGLTLANGPKVRLGFQYRIGGVLKNTQYSDMSIATTSGSQVFTFPNYGITGEVDGTALSLTAFVYAFYNSNLEQIAAGTNVTYNITYYNPSVLAVSAFSVSRCDVGGAANAAGVAAKVTIGYMVSSLGGANTKALVVKYRLVGAPTWSTFPITIGTYAGTVTDRELTGITFAQIQSYELSAEVTDRFATAARASTLSAAQALLHLSGDKLRIGIGKFCEADGPGLDIDKQTWVRDAGFFLAHVMPSCVFSNPLSETVSYSSTTRYWLPDWQTIETNAPAGLAFTPLMGGLNSLRKIGVIIPVTGFYLVTCGMHCTGGDNSTLHTYVRNMPAAPAWNPPTTRNYYVGSEVSNTIQNIYNGSYPTSGSNSSATAAGIMYLTAGTSLVPALNLGNVSKTLNSNNTRFSIMRVG